jgi:hypothetical protein
MMKAVVKNIIQSTIAAFHNEGLQVYSHLEIAYQKKEPIEVSFEGIERCATQFLNASIGKMYMQYDPHVLDTLISYNYAGLSHLAQKIEEVKENAINSKEYDSLVENATA